MSQKHFNLREMLVVVLLLCILFACTKVLLDLTSDLRFEAHGVFAWFNTWAMIGGLIGRLLGVKGMFWDAFVGVATTFALSAVDAR